LIPPSGRPRAGALTSGLFFPTGLLKAAQKKTIKSLSLAPGLELRISSIPVYSGGFIPYARTEHCKYMVVDGETSWIGTGNWEESYFRNCRDARAGG